MAETEPEVSSVEDRDRALGCGFALVFSAISWALIVVAVTCAVRSAW